MFRRFWEWLTLPKWLYLQRRGYGIIPVKRPHEDGSYNMGWLVLQNIKPTGKYRGTFVEGVAIRYYWSDPTDEWSNSARVDGRLALLDRGTIPWEPFTKTHEETLAHLNTMKPYGRW